MPHMIPFPSLYESQNLTLILVRPLVQLRSEWDRQGEGQKTKTTVPSRDHRKVATTIYKRVPNSATVSDLKHALLTQLANYSSFATS